MILFVHSFTSCQCNYLFLEYKREVLKAIQGWLAAIFGLPHNSNFKPQLLLITFRNYLHSTLISLEKSQARNTFRTLNQSLPFNDSLKKIRCIMCIVEPSLTTSKAWAWEPGSKMIKVSWKTKDWCNSTVTTTEK